MTAIIGRKFSNGVLFTGDKRVTYSNISTSEVECFDDNLKKVILLNNKMIIAFAGKVDIIKNRIDILKQIDISIYSIQEIIQKSQQIFGASLQLFRDTYPTVEYSTVYYLAGLDDKNEPFMFGFSSDDFFNERYLVNTPYKTFPADEEVRLRYTLEEKVDFSRDSIEYYVKIFSEIIRDIKSDRVGNSTYSIYLTKDSMFEYEVNEYGKVNYNEVKIFSGLSRD